MPLDMSGIEVEATVMRPDEEVWAQRAATAAPDHHRVQLTRDVKRYYCRRRCFTEHFEELTDNAVVSMAYRDLGLGWDVRMRPAYWADEDRRRRLVERERQAGSE
jgi:hypothetical protein